MASNIHTTDGALLPAAELVARINHEFSVSADIERAAQLALEWTLARTGATAGLIGAVEGTQIRVYAATGFAEEGALLPAAQLTEQSGAAGVVIPLSFRAQTVGVLYMEGGEDAADALAAVVEQLAIIVAVAQMAQEMDAARTAGADFISFITHELRAPMTAIKGYASMIAGGMAGELTEMQAKFIGTIQANVDRMAAMVANLSDIAKIEAGRLHLDCRAARVADVVEEGLAPLHERIAAKQQVLTVDMPPDLPKIWGDQARLAQIITILGDNAHKYSPPEARITVSAAHLAAEDAVRIEVADAGCGISTADQRMIFRKFFRADDERVRAAPGNGLGLYVAKHLAELQGGRLGFESAWQEGARFYVVLATN